MGVFKKQGVYWIDYYVQGHRKRERIGPDKRLAETVLRKRKVEIAEGKFLDRQKPVTTTFDELADTYFAYAVNQQRKRSWPRDRTSIRALTATSGETIDGHHASPYRAVSCMARETMSRRGRPSRPASVNRELACFKRMFTVALKGLMVLKGGVPARTLRSVSLERETNERDRVFSREEFDGLMDCGAHASQAHLAHGLPYRHAQG